MSNAEASQSTSASSVHLPNAGQGVNRFYDPFSLQTQPPLCIFQPPAASGSPVLYPKTPTYLTVSKCPQVFTFSPQATSVPWTGSYSGMTGAQQEVILPSSSMPTSYINQEVVAAGTPEFIHPRNMNMPQWLMSPPVVENDSNIVNYASVHASSPTASHPVSEKLLTPDDFQLPKPRESFVLKDTTFTTTRSSREVLECIANSPSDTDDTHPAENKEEDSGISDGVNDAETMSPSRQGSEKSSLLCSDSKPGALDLFLRDLYLLCKDSESFSDFKKSLSDSFLHCVCSTFLPFMLYTHLSHNYLKLNPTELLEKLTAASSSHDPSKETKCNIFPIGVFWDIENCAVPNGKSASAIVNKIRDRFFNDHAEAEFMAVCDINKESRHVIQDLNNAQVNVIHVNATAKNAADDKLRQSIRRYAQTHSAPATVILVTGDCNFTSEVSDLRHRHKFFVVLIHPSNTSDSLLQAANTVVSYEELVSDLPVVYATREHPGDVLLYVSNLPMQAEASTIRFKLKQLSDNCGGKVVRVQPPTAVIRFANEELAKRALKRLNGESLLGTRITVTKKSSDLSAHSKHFTPKNRAQQPYSEHKVRHTPGRNLNADSGNRPSRQQASRYAPDTTGVQLTISNIDSKLGVKAIQEAVWNMVTEYTSIWKLQIRPHNRFTVMCDVTVPDVTAASCILQHLHRRKIGSKRILVTITQRQSEQLANIKKELLPILREFGNEGIHITKMINMYWQSYQKKLFFKDLQHLQDFLILDEQPDGVYASLNRAFDKPSFPVCRLHYHPDRDPRCRFIKIEIGLREFSAKLHALLHSHNGCVFLNGFEQCFQAEFGMFPYPQDNGAGVYLEHQISYVPGVQILEDKQKVVVWSQPQSDAGSDTASEASTSSRSKTSNAVSLSREIVDLLKTRPYCSLPLDDFKSAYQNHYGHSLRVGVTSDSADILSTLPHVVQILGSPPDQLVTLTHRSQVKRFTHEIIKILKSSPDKAILMAQLPDMYLKTFSRAWNLRDYGVSVLSDILDDIPDGNICISGEGENIVLSLPTRERTPEELERTNQFARELVEILKSRHRCRMSFTEFVPAYHRQFGRQCKLANYGFTKLVDLFESLPHVVQVVDGPEKFLQLTDDEQLKVLTSQIIGLLRQGDGEPVLLPLSRVQAVFSHKYGFPLVPLHYNCVNVEALIRKLSHAVKIVKDVSGTLIVKQTERKPIRLLCAQLLVLLLDLNLDQVEQDQLHQAYRDRYSESIVAGEYGFLSLVDVLKKAISSVAKFERNESETLVTLKPLYQRAKRIRSILLQHGGSMTLGEFNQAYRTRFGEPLDAERHGFRTCEAMLRALSMVLVVKGFGIKKVVVLRNHMQHGPLSSSISVGCTSDRLTPYSDECNVATSEDDRTAGKPRPLQEQATDHGPKSEDLCCGRNSPYDDSYRPFNASRCPGAKRPTSSQPQSPRAFTAPAAREFPAPRNGGAVGSDPFYVFEPSVEQYHQYQADGDLRSHDVGQRYVTPQGGAGGGQYYQFREGSYQSPLTSYVERRDVELGARKAVERNAVALQELYQRNSDPQQRGRRFSLSVITLPTGTTSISSTPSPDSVVSTDGDSKVSSDDSNAINESSPSSPAPIRLAASFVAAATTL